MTVFAQLGRAVDFFNSATAAERITNNISVLSIDCNWRETIIRCHQLVQKHMEHLITITDELLQTGRVPTENEIFDHKVDMAMKNVMELVEN